jgi:hypothetical protein
MDIATIESWIQAIIWTIAFLLWIGRVARGEVAMHPVLKRIFSSNGLIGTVVMLGLIMSGISLYFSYHVAAIPEELIINISTYEPPYSAPMRVISNQKFEDQDIPLDGMVYQRCTFTNVCFLYDGGAYSLENSTVKKHWKVCVRDKRLENYSDLMRVLKEFNPRIKSTTKTTIPLPQ